jgi:hypothetical protein
MQEKLHNIFLVILIGVVHYGPKLNFLANSIVGKVLMLAAIILISKTYGPLSGALSSVIFVLSLYKCREGFNLGPSYSEISGVSSGGYELEALHPGLRTNSLVNITINTHGEVEGTELITNGNIEGSEVEHTESDKSETSTTETETETETENNENDQITTEENLKPKDSNDTNVSPDATASTGEITGCSLDYDKTLNLVKSFNVNSRFIETELGKYNFNQGNVDPNAILGLRSHLSSSNMVESSINSCQEHLKRLKQEQESVYNNFESNRFLLSRAKDKLDSYDTGY